MSDAEYIEALKRYLVKLAELAQKRAQVDFETTKLRQLIRATLNMLSDESRATYSAVFENAFLPQLGLTDAITRVLQAATDWLTATEVRDELISSGFSFEGYASHPLASIHTTLKRLVPDKAEMRARGNTGLAEYRWKSRYGAPSSLANMLSDEKRVEQFKKMLLKPGKK